MGLKPLADLPADTNELTHWQDITLRQVASAATDTTAALIWIRDAFDLDVPEETLIIEKPFQRLDIQIAGDIKTKILKLRKQ